MTFDDLYDNNFLELAANKSHSTTSTGAQAQEQKTSITTCPTEHRTANYFFLTQAAAAAAAEAAAAACRAWPSREKK